MPKVPLSRVSDTASASRHELRLCMLLFCLLAVLLFAAGPTLQASPQQADAQSATQALVWPPPPELPRIRYVTSFAKASELGIVKQKKKTSFFAKLAGEKEKGEQEPVIGKPYGIAVDSKKRIFVAETSGGVWRIDRDKPEMTLIQGETWARLRNSTGLAIDKQDRLFVADGSGKIVVFDSRGRAVTAFGEEQLGSAVGLAVDSNRERLYVSDIRNARVAVFNPKTYKFIEYIGERGDGPGQFGRPGYLAVDYRGFLYVTDLYNRNVQIFNRRGKFERQFGQHCRTPGCFSKPKGIAIDSELHIYVADAEFNNIQIFDQQGRPLMFFGNIGPQPGEFILVTGLCIDAQDRLYTTEQLLGRVQVFQYVSQPADGGRKGGEAPSKE